MKPATFTGMVRTRYAGPTDYRGSRVIATNINSKTRVIVPWDHALDAIGNHEIAARQCFAKGFHGCRGTDRRPLLVSGEDGGGYIFAVKT
jgi:hypothetical protein